MFDRLMISGGFDPLHGGHVDYILDAARECRRLIVALNSDEWLMRKKGYIFMPYLERARIIAMMTGSIRLSKPTMTPFARPSA